MSENIHHLSGNLLVGSSHFYVDTTNNRVGITTADPQAGLHVNSNAYVHTDFRVGSGIVMNVTGGRITAGSFEGDGSLLENVPGDSGSWVKGSSSNVHLATSTDKVGIGKDNPSHKLDVDGDINISSGSTLRVGGTPAVFSNWSVDGSDIYRSSGNVGIGTNNPQFKLHIGPVDNNHLFLASSNNSYGWIIDTDDEGNGSVPLRITKRSGGVDTEVLTIKMENGNVGIGTTSPDNSLHIYKNANERTSGLFIEKANGGTGTAAIFFGVNHSVSTTTENPGVAKAAIFYERNSTGGRGDLKFCNDASSDANNVTPETADTRMIIKNNGNVGIGTSSPDYPLDVQFTGDSGIRVKNTSASGTSGQHASVWVDSASGYSYLRFEQGGAAKFWLQSTPTGDLAFRPNGSSHVFDIRNSGRIGIGDSDPDSILHVQSDVQSGAGGPIKKTAATASTSVYNYILNGPRPGTTSGGAVHFINGSGRSTDGGTSTYTMRNDSGNTRVGSSSYSTIIAGAHSYPDRPFAMVGKNNGRVYSAGSGTTVIFNVVGYNDQSIYNSGNGRFTAPKAGYYMFSATLLAGEREHQTNTRWHLNGSEIGWGGAHYNFGSGINVNTASCRPGLTCQIIYYMNIGNYMNLKIVGGSIYGSSSIHSTVTCMYMGAK